MRQVAQPMLIIILLLFLGVIAQSSSTVTRDTVAATSTVFIGQFQEEAIASGFNIPTSFVFLPDGRILVAEKAGVVRVVVDGEILPEPFYDIRGRVNTYWDRGLISIAVDPGFEENGFVYLYYTYDLDPEHYQGPKTTHLMRVTADGDTASPYTEHLILGTDYQQTCDKYPPNSDCLPSDGPSHSAGDIKFANDGSMFVSVGDGADFRVVLDDTLQTFDFDSPRGKMLRIDRDGRGLPDNPYWTGDPDDVRSKIWAYGLRNSFRFDLHPESDVPLAGEVGHLTWESIIALERGDNLGWPCYEGDEVQNGYHVYQMCQDLYAEGPGAVVDPLITWSRTEASAAAVGGIFYTGDSYPEEFQASYFYGDYIRGLINYARFGNDLALLEGPFDFARSAGGPVDFELGPNGDIYYLALHGGELRRIRYLGAEH